MKPKLISIVNEFGPNSAPVGDLAHDLSECLKQVNGIISQNIWITKTYNPGGKRPRRLLNAAWLYTYMPFHFLALKLRSLTSSKKPAVIVITTPPLLHWWCIVLGLLIRVEVYVWFQDAHPDMSIAELQNKGWNLIPKLLAWINEALLPRATGFVALDHAMRQHLMQWNVPATKISVASPWITYIYPAAPLKVPLSGVIKVLYAGNYGRAHDLKPLTDLLRLQSSYKQQQFEFHFVGINGVAKTQLEQLFSGLAITPVFHPRFATKEDVARFMRTFDLGIVSLKDDFWGYACPSKAFTYLSQGVPILYIGRHGTLASNLVDQGFGVQLCESFLDDPITYIHGTKIPERQGIVFDDPKMSSQNAILAMVL